MEQNMTNRSIWRHGYVRFGAVLIMVCLVVTLALLIKFVFLPKNSERDENGILNKKTTQENHVNQSTTRTWATNFTTEYLPSVEETGQSLSTASPANHWVVDSYLMKKRTAFVATLMQNGEVLVSGGLISKDRLSLSSVTCEIYSPNSRKWRRASDMRAGRSKHTLTILNDQKNILTIGADDRLDSYTAEIYNIEANRWTFVSNFMNIGRSFHTATVLQNGRVVIAGGYSSQFNYATSTVQVYTPSSNTFLTVGSLSLKRFKHTATRLADGRSILIIGGVSNAYDSLSSAEIYSSGSWFSTTNNMTVGRVQHAAVLLSDGNVLIAGGTALYGQALSSAEIYNSTTRMFSTIQPMACERSSLTLTLLPTGEVLAVGGSGSVANECPLSAELYNPSTGQWASSRLLNIMHHDHATILVNNSVLVIGGENGNDQLDVCERYDL